MKVDEVGKVTSNEEELFGGRGEPRGGNPREFME